MTKVETKLTEVSVVDDNRYDKDKPPKYLATVKIKIGEAFIEVSHMPVENTGSNGAMLHARTFLERAAIFMGCRIDFTKIGDFATGGVSKPEKQPLVGEQPAEAVSLLTGLPAGRGYIEVRSSNGRFEITKDGQVMKWEPSSPDSGLENVTQFDVKEWKEYWGKELPESIDILDLGYFYKDATGVNPDGEYESPDMNWRKEIREEMQGVKRGAL